MLESPADVGTMQADPTKVRQAGRRPQMKR